MVGTGLAAEAARRHETSPTASAALGRALMGAVLLASSAKHEETVQLQFRGDGPLGTMVAIADADGRTRGYVTHPQAHPPLRDGLIDVSAGVGKGVLAVVRQRAGRPYSGLVPLVTGSVAQDLAQYLSNSEQIESAVGLGVFLRASEVEAAGGFFVQVLPGATRAEIDQAEANVRGFPGPGELVRKGLDADAIVDRVLSGLGSRERHRIQPVFHCGCGRERVLRAVALLGRDELAEAAHGTEPLEIRCQFCGESYVVSSDEIATLLAGDRGPPG